MKRIKEQYYSKSCLTDNGSELEKNMNLKTQESQGQIVNKTISIPKHMMKLPNHEHKEKILKETREKMTIYEGRTIKL